MTAYQACLLCGTEGPHVRIRLIEWAEPLDALPGSDVKRFEVIPACVDPRECRQRVEQLGETWPLALVSSDRRFA